MITILRSKEHQDPKTKDIVRIQEWCNESMIHQQLDPQSGFRLVIQPSYTVKIFQPNIPSLIKVHRQIEFTTMEECYEHFPWFFEE